MSAAAQPAATRPVLRPSHGWLRRIAAGVGLAAAGRGLALLGMTLFAALLPLDDWGRFAHGRGLLTVLAPLATGGLAVSVMRRTPQYLAQGAGDRAAAHVALGYALAAASLAPALAAALLGAVNGVTAWMLAAVPAAGALFLGTQAARAQERPALAYLPLGAASLAAALLAGALDHAGWPASRSAAPLLCAALFAAALVQAAGVLGGEAGSLRRLGANLSADMPRLRVWLAEGLPLAASLAARGAVLLGPFLLIPLWGGGASAAQAGVYGLAWLAAQAALTAMAGASGAVTPRLSAALGRGDSAQARRCAAMAAGAGAAAALLAGGLPALALAWAPETAGSLHAGLPAAAAPLAWLTLAALLQALDAPLGAALVAGGRGRSELAAQAVGAAGALTAAASAAAFAVRGLDATTAGAAVAAGGAMRLAANLALRPLAVRGGDVG